MNRLFIALSFLCVSLVTACNEDTKKITVTETTIIDQLPQDSLQVRKTKDSLTAVQHLLADINSRINRDIEISRIAEQKNTNSLVKNFSKMIQRDQQNIKTEFEKLAALKNFTLVVSLTSAHQLIAEEFKTMQDPGYDKAYIKRMIEIFQDNISTLQEEPAFPDKDIKYFAGKTIPFWRKHLEQAKAILVKL